MKVVYRNEDNIALDIFEATGLEVRGDDIYYDGGRLLGVPVPPLILSSEVPIEVGDTITQEIEALNKASEFTKEDPIEVLTNKIRTLEEIIDVLTG